MRIAIIGSGNVGGALGRAWGSRGHLITYGVRHLASEKVRQLVEESGRGARATTVAELAVEAEIVLLAVPWSAAEVALQDAGDLAGKIVVDATNPLRPNMSGLELGHTTSGGEKVAAWAPGARVVKAFNTVGAVHMAEPMIGGERASMLVCGDDAAAKETVMNLAEELGFEPIDAGPLTQARLLEPLAMLWISLAYTCGLGTDIAFRLLRR
jgi:NADPH-dependent F420 reductase